VPNDEGIKKLDVNFPFGPEDHPVFAGMELSGTSPKDTVSSADTSGMFIK